MRNPDRLNNFYDDMRRIHKKYFPDWRFTQLIMNFLGWNYQKYKNDGWYYEENKTIDLLREYAEEMTKPKESENAEENR